MTRHDRTDPAPVDLERERALQPDPALRPSGGRVSRWKLSLAAVLAALIVIMVVYGMNQEPGQPTTASSPTPAATAGVPPAGSGAPPSGPTNNPADQPARQNPQQAAQPGSTQQGGELHQSTRGDPGQEQSNQPAAPTGRADGATSGNTGSAAQQPPAPAR